MNRELIEKAIIFSIALEQNQEPEEEVIEEEVESGDRVLLEITLPE